MGAWGYGSFDNDDALDWVNQLERSKDLSAIARALNNIADKSEGYLEAPDCTIALAVAEVVAALAGNPSPSLPEEVTHWLRVHKGADADTVSKAKQAVNVILLNSELKELWQESGEFEQWRAVVTDLLSRLVLGSKKAA